MRRRSYYSVPIPTDEGYKTITFKYITTDNKICGIGIYLFKNGDEPKDNLFTNPYEEIICFDADNTFIGETIVNNKIMLINTCEGQLHEITIGEKFDIYITIIYVEDYNPDFGPSIGDGNGNDGDPNDKDNKKVIEFNFIGTYTLKDEDMIIEL